MSVNVDVPILVTVIVYVITSLGFTGVVASKFCITSFPSSFSIVLAIPVAVFTTSTPAVLTSSSFVGISPIYAIF